MSEPDNARRFNLQTMSGVFAGSRTQTYQRLWLVGSGNESEQGSWAQLLWYVEPPRTVLIRLTDASAEETAEDEIVWQSPDPDPAAIVDSLQAALVGMGWRLMTCGTCAHWQPGAESTAGGLPAGTCLSNPAEAADQSTALLQSSLAPACLHWTERPADPEHTDATDRVDKSAAPEGAVDAERDKGPGWRRWFGALAGRRPAAGQTVADDEMVEWSGVGAGTEPCLSCQGRIANLGALTAITPEGDRQTFSVWRCRQCYATYLNSWIDRWDRLDTLETEESIYRLSPAELLMILREMKRTPPMPDDARRTWFASLLGDRIPISYQVRQGR